LYFPDGEDPDSFAKKTSHDDLVVYLEDNAKDFIQFKASLLDE
jgi:DNA primase